MKKRKRNKKNDERLDALPPLESLSPSMLDNRDVSWLHFNGRVLHEAEDDRTPLLERIFFLGIFTSNLDEFFMKRVGGLRRQIAAGIEVPSIDGKTSIEQMGMIRPLVQSLQARQAECLRAIQPLLAKNAVHLVGWSDLAESERHFADQYFEKQVFPVLTPLAVDPGHPFPFISNLSLSLGVVLTHPGQDEKLFARVKVPEVLPGWIRLLPADADAQVYRFISLQDLIRHHLPELFPRMVIQSVMPFRLTRNADLDRDEEDADDLRELITQELRARRFARAVRLEHGPSPDPWIRRFLMDELELVEEDVYELSGELDHTDLRPLLDLPLPALKNPSWVPVTPPALADPDTDIFNLIRSADLLVHHPYESFSASVERFIESAADDPRVLAIKMTLYRVGNESPFVRLLTRAAESGKQVVCLVELKARFDEQRNIECAQRLEQSGVHVVYGIVGLKTHTKVALVVRREADGMRSYAHIGTGNYHPGTARLYTDLGLFTAKPDYTDDVIELFNYLTGRSLKSDYRKLLVAPVTMKDRFLSLIDKEMAHQKSGRPAGIIAKMNSLEDRQIIRSLYRASEAGVDIRLIVRGFCCLKPGQPGYSENIHVYSIIGRFLEHSRIFYFRSGAEQPAAGRFYIGSSDWMYRNLNNRVEAVTPVEEALNRQKLWHILQVMLLDHRQCWEMQPDGRYVQRSAPADTAETGTHALLMKQAQDGQAQIEAEQKRRGDERVHRRY